MSCPFCVILAVTSIVWAPLLLLGYWWWIEYQPWNPFGGPPMSYTKQVALTPVVRPGDEAVVNWQYIIYRDDCERAVELFLTNGRDQPLRRHRGSTQGQGDGPRELTSYLLIPQGTPPGPYRFRSVSHWACNPLRTYTLAAEVSFEVR